MIRRGLKKLFLMTEACAPIDAAVRVLLRSAVGRFPAVGQEANDDLLLPHGEPLDLQI